MTNSTTAANTKTRLVRTSEVTAVAHDFGAADRMGRQIGVLIRTWGETYEPHMTNDAYACSVEPGNYFAFRPHVTRNGRTYGAIQQDRIFKSAEERDAAIAKYLDEAKRRALKGAR